MDLRDQLRESAMGRMQWGVVALCILLAVIDGYEVIIMAFVAPTLAQEWDLEDATLGYALSAGLLGMAVGAMFLGSLADRIGRRKHILVCLTLGALGMILTGLATTIPQLLAARVFAGLWIGAIVASLNCIVSEFAPDRRRGTVMGIYGIGFPLGGLLGGAATGWLIDLWGWEGPFVVMGALSALMVVVTFLVLPESVEYLVERQPRNALAEYNKIARRLGYAQSDRLPAPRGGTAADSALRTVFTGTLLRRSLLLWSGYGLLIACFYFANSWTPTMIATATGSVSDGRTVGVLIGVGGIVGALAFAALSARFTPRLVTGTLLVLGLPIYVAFASLHSTGFALPIAVLVGMVTVGGVAAFNAITPSVYPTANRGAAVGFTMGFGRAVSIVVPVLMGYWFAAGGSPQTAFQFYGVVVLAAGVFVFGLHRTYRGRTEDPDLVAGEDATPVENRPRRAAMVTTAQPRKHDR